MKLWERGIVILAMTLLIIFAVLLVFGGIFFGLTGFFSLIGVTYESIGSLLLFVLYCLLVGIVFEIIEVVILILIRRTNLSNYYKWVWTALIKMGLTWVTIHIVNELMSTVVLSGFAELLTALLIVCIDIAFDDDKKTDKGVINDD